jgi:hypothetical protein
MTDRTKPALVAAAVLGLHATLVVWLTWPLAAHLGSHLPDTRSLCRTDTLAVAWTLSYLSRVLITAPSGLGAANVYHPTPNALFFTDIEFGALPYFLPPFLLTGNPALALNLTFLGCIALTAWAFHLVIVRWTGSHWGGFLAGWTFLTTHWVLWSWIPTNPHYAVLLYFPFIMLLASVPMRRLADALRLVPPVVLQALASAYLVPATFVPLGLLALVRMVRRSTWTAGLRLLGALALAAVLLFPAFAGTLRVRTDNPRISAQTPFPHILGYAHTRLPWGPFDSGEPTGIPLACWPVIVAGAASAAARARRREIGPARAAWSQGLFWTAVGLAISLTPVVDWNGHLVTVPWDALARRLPLYEALRARGRLGLVALMGLAVLMGVAAAECLRRLPRARDGSRSAATAWLTRALLTGAVAAAMYASYARGMRPGVMVGIPGGPLPGTYPIARVLAPDSPLIRILRQPGGPLLELPVGSGGIPHAQAMYRSIFHHRPLLNGYASYWPAGFPGRMALACRLPDPDALAALRRDTGLEMVLVRLAILGEPTLARPPYRCGPRPAVGGAAAGSGAAAERARWLEIVRQPRADLRLVARDGDDLLFAVADGAALGPQGAR